MSLKTRWILLGLLVIVPYVVLLLVGMVWLYERGWMFYWMLGAAALSLISWPCLVLLRKASRKKAQLSTTLTAPGTPSATSPPGADWSVTPEEHWPPMGRAAWKDVEQIAQRTAAQEFSFTDLPRMQQVIEEVFTAVARHYHPGSRSPMLEIPVPHVLHVIELVAHDLRVAFSANIPGSHILTIHDLVRLQKIASYYPTVYRLYRIASLAVNPASALMRELNAYVQDRVMTASTEDTRVWAVQFAVKRAGYYAIELYSGNLALRDVEFQPYVSQSSRRSLEAEQRREAAFAEEPLRILILGQVKAGKSSLVNALFGETKAAVDIVPRTRYIHPYLLERDGIKRAIILDTAGYQDPTHTANVIQQVSEEALKSDIILLTTSATSAAREADRKLLDELRLLYQQHPDREHPPVFVVLTHIDQLRPSREWNPPYNLREPNTPKAQTILAAITAVATDLDWDPARVIPVCLLSGQTYNVEDGLIPIILQSLDAARRSQYLRCLREYKDEAYWNQLWQQAGNSGKILLQAGWQLLGNSKLNMSDIAQRFIMPGKKPGP